jgi:hypothetical protein
MSTKEPINRSSERETSPPAGLTDVLEESISFQLLQGLARIENRLQAIESRLEGGRGSTTRRIEKPNIRNILIAQLQKGWLSEVEALEKTGWQTIGVRSFVTKLRTLGLAVETEERDGVPFYRIAK